MSKNSPSKLIRGMHTADTLVIFRQWCEAYESGWRPLMYVESELERMYHEVMLILKTVDNDQT
jgi:hypothetical protein